MSLKDKNRPLLRVVSEVARCTFVYTKGFLAIYDGRIDATSNPVSNDVN
jgi:hypothetical protein